MIAFNSKTAHTTWDCRSAVRKRVSCGPLKA